MAVMTKSILRLMPRVFGLKIKKLASAIALSVQAVYDYAANTLRESRPGTSTDLLGEWAQDFAVDVSKLNDNATKRKRLSTAWSAVGGQSLDYVQSEIRRELSKITITETGINTYEITGDVDSNSAWQRLQGLQRRLAPLHCEPTYNVRIVEGLSVGRTGVGATGAMITGKEE